MTTKNVSINDTEYTQVTTVDDFFVENISAVRIRYAVSDTQPAIGSPYHKLNSSCVVTSALVTGTIWAMSDTGIGAVAVTE